MFKRLLIAILFTLVVNAQAADLAIFDETFGNFSEELDNARSQGKQGILIMFEIDDCPFCLRMKTTILNQPEVIDYFKQHFLVFSVDIEGDVEITDFDGKLTTQKDFSFKQHRVRATPVFAFFDLQGQRVLRYTGATSSAEEFLWLGEFFVTEKYREMNFTRFKRGKQKNAG